LGILILGGLASNKQQDRGSQGENYILLHKGQNVRLDGKRSAAVGTRSDPRNQRWVLSQLG
jgi:hypothetical protein